VNDVKAASCLMSFDHPPNETHLLHGLSQRVVDGNHPGHEQLVDDDQVAIKPAEHLAGPGDGALEDYDC